ncbi:MAG TPA: DUF4184 family protein [Gemmatimonadaceae bacterium]|nr:DUF4184 family protein [Gemmatimonadaceae bacterium]
MPLTPAHAAVAPLLRRLTRRFGLTVPMSAMVIGTMIPDFAYLIRLAPGGGTWHTPRGLLLYCLPAGLITWWIFRAIIGPALLRLLPPGLGVAAAATIAPGSTFRLLPSASVAIVIGALSHDLWDSFTHESRWGVRQIPELDTRVHLFPHSSAHLYLLLQYASSLIGLIIVAAMIWDWVSALPRSARYVPAGERAWRVREVGLLMLAAVAGAVLNESRPHPPGLSWRLGLAAVGGMSALAAALLAYGMIDLLRHRPVPGSLESEAND